VGYSIPWYEHPGHPGSLSIRHQAQGVACMTHPQYTLSLPVGLGLVGPYWPAGPEQPSPPQGTAAGAPRRLSMCSSAAQRITAATCVSVWWLLCCTHPMCRPITCVCCCLLLISSHCAAVHALLCRPSVALSSMTGCFPELCERCNTAEGVNVLLHSIYGMQVGHVCWHNNVRP
jgi:hypothetical protein